MSGHSKWSKIKRKKGETDAARSKLFSKLGKEIYVAAKNGDPDVNNNAALRLAVEKAKAQSMPKDNINKAIERAKGSESGAAFEEIIYEGYGAGGTAVMVYCLTDNRNRTAGAMKATFTRGGGNLGANGSVGYLFTRRGLLVLDKAQFDVDDVFTKLLEVEIEDIIEEDEYIIIYIEPVNFLEVKQRIDEVLDNPDYLDAQVTMVPNMYAQVSDEEKEKVMRLVEKLEDNDDVQEVYYNLK